MLSCKYCFGSWTIRLKVCLCVYSLKVFVTLSCAVYLLLSHLVGYFIFLKLPTVSLTFSATAKVLSYFFIID